MIINNVVNYPFTSYSRFVAGKICSEKDLVLNSAEQNTIFSALKAEQERIEKLNEEIDGGITIEKLVIIIIGALLVVVSIIGAFWCCNSVSEAKKMEPLSLHSQNSEMTLTNNVT